jgi:hypothetical protein
MKRIIYVAILMVLGVGAGLKLTSAQPTAHDGDNLLRYLPDGNAAAIIDFQRIAGSSLWAAINAQDKLKSEIGKAQSGDGKPWRIFDRRTHGRSGLRGFKLQEPHRRIGGRFEQNDLLGRLRTSGKVSLTSEKYKGLDIFKARSIAATDRSKEPSAANPTRNSIASVARDETSFVFYDASTVVVGSSEAVRASVDVKTGATPGLILNSQLSDALAQNPAAAIRFALSLTPR